MRNSKRLTQWALVPLGLIIKTNNYAKNLQCNKQPYDEKKRYFKGLTQWTFVPLGATIKQTNISHMKIKQTSLRCNTKHKEGINMIGLGAPWFHFSQQSPTKLQNRVT